MLCAPGDDPHDFRRQESSRGFRFYLGHRSPALQPRIPPVFDVAKAPDQQSAAQVTMNMPTMMKPAVLMSKLAM